MQKYVDISTLLIVKLQVICLLDLGTLGVDVDAFSPGKRLS